MQALGLGAADVVVAKKCYHSSPVKRRDLQIEEEETTNGNAMAYSYYIFFFFFFRYSTGPYKGITYCVCVAECVDNSR